MMDLVHFILLIFLYFIFGFILLFFILNLGKRCDVMSQIVTDTERCVTYVTVTQTCDTEKNIEGSRIDNII